MYIYPSELRFHQSTNATISISMAAVWWKFKCSTLQPATNMDKKTIYDTLGPRAVTGDTSQPFRATCLQETWTIRALEPLLRVKHPGLEPMTLLMPGVEGPKLTEPEQSQLTVAPLMKKLNQMHKSEGEQNHFKIKGEFKILLRASMTSC